MTLHVESAPDAQGTAVFEGEEFTDTFVLRDSAQFIGGSSDMTADVRKILMRPKALTKWDLSTTSPNYDLNWDFFNDNFNIGTRFAGALGFRATVCFRYVFAVPPQVGGRVRAYYNPSYQQESLKVYSSYRDMTDYSTTVNSITQLPGVEIDLSSATAMDFSVPYTSFLDFMPIVSSVGDKRPEMTLGRVSLTNYLPLAIVAGADSVYCTIYAWLEDIEIIGARNPDLVKVNVDTTPSRDFYDTTVVPSGYVDGTGSRQFNATNASVVFNGVINGTGAPGPNRAEISVLRFGASSFEGAVKVYNADGSTRSYPISFFTASATAVVIKWVEDVEKVVEFGPAVEPQSGTLRKAAEEDVENDGPLSGPLYSASKVASSVSKYIPSLSSIATPISWATRIASNVVAAFGYSRPLQLEANHRYWNTQNHYQNNADGPDTSFNLGLLQDNKLCVIDNGGGTNIDEMAIEFIATKNACIGRFLLSPSSSGLRYSVSLCPNSMYCVEDIGSLTHYQVPFEWLALEKKENTELGLDLPNANSGTVLNTTPNFMLGTMFKYFRGGFRFRIKCNKTRFHAGRLSVMFTPYSVLDTEVRDIWVPSIADDLAGTVDLLGHVKIWDLREDSEIVFECPYIYAKPYCEVYEPYGSLTISVVDNLTAPENVSNTLTFAVEVEAMEGFEYSFPYQGDYVVAPDADYRVQQVDGGIEPLSTEIQAQSGMVDKGQCPFPVDSVDMSCECIGERIMSVKQLLSRAEWTTITPLFRSQGLEGTTSPVALPRWFDAPCYMGNRLINNDSNYGLYGSYKKSTHHILLYCYLFARGSTNYDIISYDKTPNSGTTTYQRPETLVTFADEDNPEQGLLGTGSVVIEEGPFLHVKSPFYSLTKKLCTLPFDDKVESSVRGTLKSQRAQVSGKAYYYGPNNSKLSVRAGDDAQLSFFLCTPPMMYAVQGPFAVSGKSFSAIGGSIDGGQLAPKFVRQVPST